MLSPEAEAAAGQFQSALAMLRKAIEFCPPDLWLEGSPNRFWHIVYHTLFYTHFYLSPSDAEFTSWPLHRAEYNFLGEIPGKPGYKPRIDQPYTQLEMLDYHDFCVREVARRLADLDPAAPSGFYWLPFSKLQLQFYNLRHLAHHTGQLAERLRASAGIGLPWVR